MIIQKNCDFVNKAAEPMTSKIFTNGSGDVLSLQINGATGTYRLEGRNNSNGDWVTLGGINLSNFSAVRDSFSAPGLYEIGIVGVRELRVIVESVFGEVSIFGQIISTEET